MEKIRLETCSNNKKLIEFVTDNYPICIQNIEQNGEHVKKINFRLLAQMLSDSIIEGDEAYELTWVGKKAAIVEANKTTTKTLRPRHSRVRLQKKPQLNRNMLVKAVWY